MPSFVIASPEEQAKLGAPKGAGGQPVDMAPYIVLVDQLVSNASPDNPKFSVWAKLGLLDGDGPRSERERIRKAAEAQGRYVQFSVNPDDKRIIYLRLRPAPKTRKPKENGAVTNGTITTPPIAPVEPAPVAAKK